MTVIRLPSMVMGAPAPRWISRRSAAEDAVIRHSSTQAARPSRTTSRSTSFAPGQGQRSGFGPTTVSLTGSPAA